VEAPQVKEDAMTTTRRIGPVGLLLAAALALAPATPARADDDHGGPSDAARRFFGAADGDRGRKEEKAEPDPGGRVCIKSYPWPGGFSDERFRKMTAASMRKVRDGIDSLTTRFEAGDPGLKDDVGRLPSHERQLYRELPNEDPEQIRLYGDFLCLLTMNREGRYEEVLKFLAQVGGRHDLTVRPGGDWGEESTYFSRQSLRNKMAVLGYTARVTARADSAADVFRLAAEFLDDRPALLPHQNLVGDPTVIILDRLAEQAERLPLDAPAAERRKALDDVTQLAGFSRSGRETTLYLQGRRLHAVVVDENGLARLVDPDDAAETFRSSALEAIRTGTTEKQTLFHAMKYGDEFEIDFPGGRQVKLSAEDWQRLQKGEPLPKGHPLTRALAGAGKEVVLWDNPLLRKDGPQLRAARDLVAALGKCFPDRKVRLAGEE
jgi:hypothetical protein